MRSLAAEWYHHDFLKYFKFEIKHFFKNNWTTETNNVAFKSPDTVES